MILVTGAAGKTGQAVIRALVARGASVRALVHRPGQVSVVEALGARQAIAGDMRDPATVAGAVRGVGAVYHICPNVHPDETGIGERAIAATRAAGVEHFVYHSVLHPQVEALPHHWLKMRVEEKLFESGLDYTILQPAAYMQNVLAQWDSMVGQGIYSVPYAVDTRLGMVDLEDVAEAAAIVLTESGHTGATYELAGPQALTQTEVAKILGQSSLGDRSTPKLRPSMPGSGRRGQPAWATTRSVRCSRCSATTRTTDSGATRGCWVCCWGGRQPRLPGLWSGLPVNGWENRGPCPE